MMHPGARFALWGDSSGPTPPLPYDAEVEYIQSNITSAGPQWIDSGVQYSRTVGWKIDAWTGSFTFDENPTIIGVNDGEFNNTCLTFEESGEVVTDILGAEIACDIETRFLLKANYKNDHKMWLSPITWGTDGDGVYPNFDLPYNVGIFCAMTENGPSYFIDLTRIYSLEITDGSNVVRDFIPVRVGQVGYLYDRANPTGGPNGNGLYGNDGHGAFVLGPDK